MIIKLGAAIQMKVQHLQLRGGIYQFYLRVPQSLLGHYGQKFIRKSLGTSDLKEAARKAEELARKYRAEFKVLSEGSRSIPEDVAIAGRLLAEQYSMNLDDFISLVADPAREQYADGDEETYYNASPSEFLDPVQQVAWKLMVNPNAVRLSTALTVYFKSHTKGTNDAFIKYTSRHWNSLIEVIGDIEFEQLSRSHARQFVDHQLAKGNKTGTVRRMLKTIGAIVRTTITELELKKTDPFTSIKIQGEGNDAEEGKTATPEQLKEIAKAFLPDTTSPTALVALMQMELGTRIGEVSGLGIDDVFLDHEIPHVYFRDRPWRTLKTRNSERRVPVVGVALEALKHAIALPRTGVALFESYAKPRGSDSASGAVNKRLKKWDITSHDFRHTMKDRLREAGCPKDIRDAIQGHTSGDVADNYGQGHSLKTMQGWLEKVKIVLPA